MDLALFCVPAAVVGARVYYVLFNLDYYQGDFLKMINIREGGMAIHGSLIAAFLVGFFVIRYKKKSFLQYADLVAPAVILGQAIGRWGNFANGEAHGGPTSLPWGIMVDGVKVHPTFLYESLWNFGVFILLVFLSRRKKFKGQIILLYGILYSVGRFFIEGLRTDSLMVLGLRTAQLVSLIIIIVFGVFYAYLDFKERKRESGEDEVIEETETAEEVETLEVAKEVDAVGVANEVDANEEVEKVTTEMESAESGKKGSEI